MVSTDDRTDQSQVIAFGAVVVALLIAGVVTLFAVADDSDGEASEQLSIGSTIATTSIAARPTPTYDASISDLSITDEPIVIDADGDIVDLDGGNAGDLLPSESDADSDDGLNLLGGDDPEDKLMPDLFCRGLQAAQDEIQDHGVFGSKSKDATGQGRRQIWDRNWVVVAQEPEPGEPIGEFDATLFVVKKSDDENICD